MSLLFGLISEIQLDSSIVFSSLVQTMASIEFWLSLWNMLNFPRICPYTVEFGLKMCFYYILLFSGVYM